MNADREKKVAGIKDEIAQGEYRIDPEAVADAIIRRLREHAAAAACTASPGTLRQNECS